MRLSCRISQSSGLHFQYHGQVYHYINYICIHLVCPVEVVYMSYIQKFSGGYNVIYAVYFYTLLIYLVYPYIEILGILSIPLLQCILSSVYLLVVYGAPLGISRISGSTYRRILKGYFLKYI